jgi:beta-lactam-binding protein with PASTA domain
MSDRQAEQAMKQAGFHVTLTKATHTPGIPRGTVVKQDPAAGTTAPQNEGVKLWVED